MGRRAKNMRNVSVSCDEFYAIKTNRVAAFCGDQTGASLNPVEQKSIRAVQKVEGTNLFARLI